MKNDKTQMLVTKVLQMNDSKFYSLKEFNDIIDIPMPLPGSIWKLLMHREILEYFNFNKHGKINIKGFNSSETVG